MMPYINQYLVTLDENGKPIQQPKPPTTTFTFTNKSTVTSSPTPSPSSTSSTSPNNHCHDDHNYGDHSSCSTYQKLWQLSHPMLSAVRTKRTIRHWLRDNDKDDNVENNEDYSIINPPLSYQLSPAICPNIIYFIQQKLELWVPDYFLCHLVSFMPCPHLSCHLVTHRGGWLKGGPRVIHGLQTSSYLHTCYYYCSSHGPFSGFDRSSIAKLNPLAQERFQYVLTKTQGVTIEVHQLIENCKINGTSLSAVRDMMIENRYLRLYKSMKSYYLFCKQHLLYLLSKESSSSSSSSPPNFTPFLPLISTDLYYRDHIPMDVSFFADLYDDWVSTKEPGWLYHFQQHTPEDVCMDTTYEVAQKVIGAGPGAGIFTLMDVKTRMVIGQQFVQTQSHAELLPIFTTHAKRCDVLDRPLPRRVVSDRGIMDAALIQSIHAFPLTHIIVDHFHYVQRFEFTLVPTSTTKKAAKSEFSNALFVYVKDESGKAVKTYPNPEDLINKVDAIISHYSSCQSPCITPATHTWWNNQIYSLRNHRILANPKDDQSWSTITSSPLENLHRYLNRAANHIITMSAKSLTNFLAHFRSRWNTDRAVGAKLIHNFNCYDVDLLRTCYELVCEIHGSEVAAVMWEGGFKPISSTRNIPYGTDIAAPAPARSFISPPVHSSSNVLNSSQRLIDSMFVLSRSIDDNDSISPLDPSSVSQAVTSSHVLPDSLTKPVTQSATHISFANDQRDVLQDEQTFDTSSQHNQPTNQSTSFTSSQSQFLLTSNTTTSHNQPTTSKTKYIPVPIKTEPFSPFEQKSIRSIAHASLQGTRNGVPIVNWPLALAKWQSLWNASKATQQIWPRLLSVLRGQYYTKKRARELKQSKSQSSSRDVASDDAQSDIDTDDNDNSEASVVSGRWRKPEADHFVEMYDKYPNLSHDEFNSERVRIGLSTVTYPRFRGKKANVQLAREKAALKAALKLASKNDTATGVLDKDKCRQVDTVCEDDTESYDNERPSKRQKTMSL